MSPATAHVPDSRYAWIRLVISLVLAIVGLVIPAALLIGGWVLYGG